MSEEKKILDSEIKALFQDEFDANEISVSEDLFARTMASINKLKSEPEAKENTTPVTDITARKKRLFRIISGIAAALFIGVVGFAIIRIGGGISKKESADLAGNTSMATDNSYSESPVSNSIQPINAPSEFKISNNNSFISEAAIPNSSTRDDSIRENDSSTENSYSSESKELGSVSNESAESEPEETSTNHTKNESPVIHEDNNSDEIEKTEDSGDAETSDNKKEDEPTVTRIIESDITENGYSVFYTIVDQYINNITGDVSFTLDPEYIRSLASYQNLLSCGTEAEPVVLELLSESTEDGAKEYILALLVEDLSGKSFNDPEGNALWKTGKEYLELFKE